MWYRVKNMEKFLHNILMALQGKKEFLNTQGLSFVKAYGVCCPHPKKVVDPWSRSVFHSLFSPRAHPILSDT
jgi:hypothetical protein